MKLVSPLEHNISLITVALLTCVRDILVNVEYFMYAGPLRGYKFPFMKIYSIIIGFYGCIIQTYIFEEGPTPKLWPWALDGPACLSPCTLCKLVPNTNTNPNPGQMGGIHEVVRQHTNQFHISAHPCFILHIDESQYFLLFCLV